MKIAVVGMGKIGLPLAVQFASKGFQTVGYDINEDTVKLINEGQEPFPNETGLRDLLGSVIADGTLSATTNPRVAFSKATHIVIVVPLVVDSDARPDFSALDDVTLRIAKELRPGVLISYETTVPVGSTRNRFSKVLEVESGRTAGEDFFVVFSPERVLSGRVFQDLRRYPKIVGGVSKNCTDAGVRFYESVLDFESRLDLPRSNGVWPMGSCEEAEFVKLAETTYRDVNIGLANQFARFADSHGLDVYAVIDAANSQPFSHIHQPGIAVGGHCIPVYPQFYLWNDPQASVVRAAREENRNMPVYAIDVLENALGSLQDCQVLLLGACYRSGVKELAFSGIFALRDELIRRGARPLVYDSLFSLDELKHSGLEPFEARHSSVVAAIFQNDDPANFDLLKNLPSKPDVVIDGRRAIENAKDKVDFRVLTLGHLCRPTL